ncbi:hypothetical protein CRM22_008920 [Opisthorchis felineus]|uniref:MYND-type domain-containing protein n=3 Tax=Opisthorchis felineus TaxID=147828 RepID=A0A4S2L943_OPIFE|nr:hypothetical protein CRM22_008920 [Opisthorchis felineus]
MVRGAYIQESVVVHSLLSSRLNTVCDSCLRVSGVLCSCAACGVMHYCNRHCQRTMWPIHKAECKQYGAVKHIPTAQVRLLLRMILLKDSKSGAFFTSLMSHSDDFRKDMRFLTEFSTVLQTISQFFCQRLPVPESSIFDLYCQLKINSFMITDSSGVPIGPGIFRRASRFDHSCHPNLEYIFQGKNLICLPVLPISTPEEARINYVDPLATREQRRKELLGRYFFYCECPLCQDSERDDRISALICCDTPLQSPGPKLLPSDQTEQPGLVRRCCQCDSVYDDACILQVITQFLEFREKAVTVEAIADSIILYRQMREISGPVGLRALSNYCSTGGEQVDRYSYYRLFGHPNSVYLAQVCRSACAGFAEEYTEPIAKTFGMSIGSTSWRTTLIDTLIACGLDLLYWKTHLLPWPAFVTGLHASIFAGFLLRHVTDHEFQSPEYMERIKSMCASTPSEPNLAQVLCRLINVADDILAPFAPFDDQIRNALVRLRSYL